MAEEMRRSFDLKSWQGLTEVLKVARESNLSPSVYSDFRNLVLEYAQQKGSDPILKKKIDDIIASFGTKRVESEKTASEPIQKSEEPPRHGRRVVPTFMPRFADSGSRTELPDMPKVVTPTPPVRPDIPVSIPVATAVALDVGVANESKPVEIHHTPAEAVPLRSIEEHRARITEVKRRVNSLVGNPVTLMDHGNSLGREYMAALLNALKATSPGSTLNTEAAMTELERTFALILDHVGNPSPESRPAPVTDTPADTSSPQIVDEVVPVVNPTESVSEVAASAPDVVVPPEVGDTVAPTEVVEVPAPIEEVLPEQEIIVEAPRAPLTSELDEIQRLRRELEEHQIPPPASTRQHSLIPSIIDIEEATVSRAAPYGDENARHMQPEELSPAALTQRPLSTTTGITLGTPQAELMTPDVTMSLSELLHEWNIFASSGLFGMGPGGIEHPLYVRLARLPMGEVLSGRFEGADMKIVRTIKDYVDAWRHEQAIAYNPSETFEHYLRRVAQRIMKRQRGIVEAQ